MTENEAQRKLEIMVQASTEPTLSTDEVQLLLDSVKLVDSENRLPTDAAWEGNYDLNRAASQGWEWKAGKVASWYAFSDSGSSFNRQQVYDHCMAIAKRYANKVVSIVNLPGYLSVLSGTDDETVVND